MAEWSIAAVLKTVEPRGSWGSNPYFSAKIIKAKHIAWLFLFLERQKLAFVSEVETKKAIIHSAAAERISFNYYEAPLLGSRVLSDA